MRKGHDLNRGAPFVVPGFPHSSHISSRIRIPHSSSPLCTGSKFRIPHPSSNSLLHSRECKPSHERVQVHPHMPSRGIVVGGVPSIPLLHEPVLLKSTQERPLVHEHSVVRRNVQRESTDGEQIGDVHVAGGGASGGG